MREKERTLEIACIHARIARNVSTYWPTRNEHGRARWRDNRRHRRRRIRHHLSDRSRGRGARGEASGLAGPGQGEVRDNQSCHTGLLRARATCDSHFQTRKSRNSYSIAVDGIDGSRRDDSGACSDRDKSYEIYLDDFRFESKYPCRAPKCTS